ncbi:hypothetical protein [Pyruvatibacter sp.]|uniref:hypothetical protein n=1 Tax=Pyruvatibacter sp. TaxID=1981328 RepID=UPI0032EBE381
MQRSPVHSALEQLCFAVMPLRDCLRGHRRAQLMAALRAATRVLAGHEARVPEGRGTPRQRCAVDVHLAALDLALALGVPRAELVPHFTNRVETGAGPLSPELAIQRLHQALDATAAEHLEAEKDTWS